MNEDKALERRKRTRRRVLTFLFTIVCLFVADQLIRSWEMVQLVSGIETSEQIINTYKADIYSASSTGDFSQADKAIATLSAAAKPELEKAQMQVKEVFTLPWHFGIQSARSEYVLHVDAWIKSMVTSAVEGDGVIQSPTDIDLINSSWDTFITAVRAAVPWIQLGDVVSRIDVVEQG